MKKLISSLFFICIMLAASIAFAAGEWEIMPLSEKPSDKANPAAIPPDGLATKGEGFQYVFALAYAPSNPKRAYFGVDTTGVWRSDDGGENWRPMYKGFDANGAVSLAVDPKNPDIVLAAGFYGMERKRSEPYPQRIQGIYRTTDGGNSWKKMYNTGFYRRYGKGTLLAFVPGSEQGAQTNTVFAASSDDGLLRSDDNGLNWKKVYVRLSGGGNIGEIHDIKLLPGTSPHDPVILAVTELGLLKIQGAQAVKIGKGLPDVSKLSQDERAKLGPMSIAVSPADKNLVLVAAGTAGIWRSTDQGASFTVAGFSGVDYLKSAFLKASISDVSLSPVDANIAYARAHLVGLKPMYSTDGGKSWQSAENTNVDNLLIKEGFYFSSPFAPHPFEAKDALHVANGMEKILKTTDGGASWRYSGRGYTGGAMNSMSFLSANEFYLALTDYGLWHSSDNGYSFKQVPLARMFGSLTVESVSARKNANGSVSILVSVGQWFKRGVALSHNGGKTWEYNENVPSNLGIAFLHPSEYNLMFISGHVSRNAGKSWTPLGNTVTGELILYAVDKKNNYTLYALGERNKKAVLYKSQDQGKNWSQIGTALNIQRRDVKALAVSPLGIYAATTGGVLITNPESVAATWKKAENFPADPYGSRFATAIAINERNPNEIWVGCRNPGTGKRDGVVKSLDGGKTWQTESTDSGPLFTVTKIYINPFDNTVYAGSYSGTFRLKK